MPQLISATLTEDAYKVYCEWKKNRTASHKISMAMTQLRNIQELNAALMTQTNILKARWKFLEENLEYLIKEGGYDAKKIIDLAKKNDSLYYRSDI